MNKFSVFFLLILVQFLKGFDINTKELKNHRLEEACIKIDQCSDSCLCAKLNAKSDDQQCRNSAGEIDYLQVHYCFLQNSLPLSVVLYSFWLIFLFYLLVNTTRDWFIPNISRLSSKLRWSSSVAGVTFLAFNNGSPIFFSSVTGIIFGSSSIGFSSLIGSSVFIVTVVLAAATFTTKIENIARRPFLRDSFFLLIIGTCCFLMVQDGKIFLWESCTLISAYVLYLIFVIAARHIYLKMKATNRHELTIPLLTEDDISALDAPQQSLNSGSSKKLEGYFEDSEYFPMLDEAIYLPSSHRSLSRKTSSHRANGELIFSYDNPGIFSTLKSRLYDFGVLISWHNKSFLGKFFFLILWPSILARNLTIPRVFNSNNSDNSSSKSLKWNRIFLILNPIFSSLFILFVVKKFNSTITIGSSEVPVFIFVFIGGVFGSILVFFFLRFLTSLSQIKQTNNNSRVSPKPFSFDSEENSDSNLGTSSVTSVTSTDYSFSFSQEKDGKQNHKNAVKKITIVIMLLGFVLSGFWLYLVSTEILSVIRAIGRITNIPEQLLALTVESVGMSLVALATTVIVSKKDPSMAISSCFGGSSFNILLGGIALTASNILTYPEPFQVEFDKFLLVAFIALAVCLLFSIIFIPVSRFSVPKRIGFGLILLYLVYFTFIMCVQFQIL